MDSLISGTMVGSGSFRCRRCGYVLALIASDALPNCPGCGGRDFVRASLFSAGVPFDRGRTLPYEMAVWAPRAPGDGGEDGERWLETARAMVREGGDHLAYVEDDGEIAIITVAEGWTRIGRSLAADIRLDDPTVSRRHALIVRHDDGVRVLDDRSLNGVFVNGERVDGRVLRDGDELMIGRYRLRAILGEGAVISGRGPGEDAGLTR